MLFNCSRKILLYMYIKETGEHIIFHTDSYNGREQSLSPLYLSLSLALSCSLTHTHIYMRSYFIQWAPTFIWCYSACNPLRNLKKEIDTILLYVKLWRREQMPKSCINTQGADTIMRLDGLVWYSQFDTWEICSATSSFMLLTFPSHVYDYIWLQCQSRPSPECVITTTD